MAIKHRVEGAPDESAFLKKRLAKAATFTKNGEWEVIKLKGAFPFRLKEDGDQCVLQSSTMNGGSGYKWNKRMTGTRSECYSYLIEFNNKRVKPGNGLERI